jgi:hypothetical protein
VAKCVQLLLNSIAETLLWILHPWISADIIYYTVNAPDREEGHRGSRLKTIDDKTERAAGLWASATSGS